MVWSAMRTNFWCAYRFHFFQTTQPLLLLYLKSYQSFWVSINRYFDLLLANTCNNFLHLDMQWYVVRFINAMGEKSMKTKNNNYIKLNNFHSRTTCLNFLFVVHCTMLKKKLTFLLLMFKYWDAYTNIPNRSRNSIKR